MPFDARSAKALAHGQHLTIDEHPGLRLKASKTKNTWIYRYKSPVDQRMRQIKIGEWPAMSYHSAVAAWEILRKSRREGEDLAQEKRSRLYARRLIESGGSGEITVRDVCDLYLKGHIKNRAEKGQREIERMFSTMLDEIEHLPATSVNRKVAFDHIKRFEHAPVQATNLRRELGAAWDYCLDSGVLPQETPNWWRQILRGKLKSKGKAKRGVRNGVTKRVLSPAEVGQLIRWLPNFSRNVHDMLTMYLWTGVRGAEIEKIEGAEVREENGTIWWTIPKHKTKNCNRADADDQRVPLVGRARDIVIRRKEAHGDGYLFPATNTLGYFVQKNVGVAVHYHMPYSLTKPKSERLRLPVEGWAPHDLRRTARTFLASLGCPRDIGEVILGHMLKGDEGTYNRYTFDNERLEWLMKLSNYLERLAMQ